MNKILAFIVFLLFLLLLWYSYGEYQDCCNDLSTDKEKTPQQETVKTEKIKKQEPLVYNWNSDKAITNEAWDAKRKNILSSMTDGKILRITGPYFKEEGKELGVARAKSAFKKLKSNLNSKRVEYSSKLIDFYEDAKTSQFAGTDFSWKVRNNNITEIDNKALIYFPSNSTKKLSNVNIINYLKDVANSVKGNNKKILLSGHSDSRGNGTLNKKLALARANSIKNELIRLGVTANRISTISYGEEKPIASNDTKEGQQKNRRVELEIK